MCGGNVPGRMQAAIEIFIIYGTQKTRGKNRTLIGRKKSVAEQRVTAADASIRSPHQLSTVNHRMLSVCLSVCPHSLNATTASPLSRVIIRGIMSTVGCDEWGSAVTVFRNDFDVVEEKRRFLTTFILWTIFGRPLQVTVRPVLW